MIYEAPVDVLVAERSVWVSVVDRFPVFLRAGTDAEKAQSARIHGAIMRALEQDGNIIRVTGLSIDDRRVILASSRG